MKGFALGLAWKQRQNATRKSPNCKTRTQDNSIGARSCRRSRDTRPPPALGNSYYTKVSYLEEFGRLPLCVCVVMQPSNLTSSHLSPRHLSD